MTPSNPKPDHLTRLVTWNVNSVRARMDHVMKLIDLWQPDVLCLQETKVVDDSFPTKNFLNEGYTHHHFRGQKTHHGVAIFSRLPLTDPDHINWCEKGDPRHVAATLPGGIDLHNFYVPAGGDEPDAEVNDKFAHKLQFMNEMISWSEGLKTPSIMVGDLNVAPLEMDVWSHKALLKVISHTPLETGLMDKMMDAHDWVDAMRHFIDDNEPLFTWWSYRSKNWRINNRGRRLDHVWVSPSLREKLVAMCVVEEARDWEKPSDHAPVIVDFDFS